MRRSPECVELQHRGGARIQALLDRMTDAERVAYWAERSRALRERQTRARAQAPGAGVGGADEAATG